MNADRRERQRDNRAQGGGHTSYDHHPLQIQAALKAQEQGHRTAGPVNCPVCRPGTKTWDRDLAGKAT